MDRDVGGRKCLYAARVSVSQIPLEIYLGHGPSPTIPPKSLSTSWAH